MRNSDSRRRNLRTRRSDALVRAKLRRFHSLWHAGHTMVIVQSVERICHKEKILAEATRLGPVLEKK